MKYNSTNHSIEYDDGSFFCQLAEKVSTEDAYNLADSIKNGIYGLKTWQEEKEKLEKEIYALLIEQIGFDSGACCGWMGVDATSLEDWKKAWWSSLREYGEYEQSIGAYNERKRIAEELLVLNE